MTMISSQRYLDDAIVAAKIAAGNFVVTLSPEFEIDGVAYSVVMDGHHAYAAARESGVAPEFREVSDADNCLPLLRAGDIDGFLACAQIEPGTDYYDIETGINVW